MYDIMGLGWVRMLVTRSNLRTLLFKSRATYLVKSSSKKVRIFVLILSRSSLIMGCVSSKSKPVGTIFLKVGQNVCFDDISIMINHGSDGVKK